MNNEAMNNDGMVHQCRKTRLQILGNCSACAGRVVPEARIETKQAAQVGQNPLQKPLAWFRYAATKSVAATQPALASLT